MALFKKKKAVSVLPSDYLTSVCELQNMDNELLSTGMISEITPEYVKISKKSEALMMLRTGSQIKVKVFNTKKGFKVLLGIVYTSTGDFIKIVDLVELADHDRRQFFRMNMELTAFVYEDGDIESARKLPINIVDMSLSGMRIEMDPPPEIGDVIWIELLLSGRAFCCQCRVMRRIETGKSTAEVFGSELREDAKKLIDEGKTDLLSAKKSEIFTDEELETEDRIRILDRRGGAFNDNTKKDGIQYQYGCAFLFSEYDDTDPLCAFLFKKQGEQLRKIRAADENSKKLGSIK